MMLCVETTSISVDFSCRKEKVEEREEDASESFSDNSLRTFFASKVHHNS